MNKNEAATAMYNGEAVRHRYFDNHEFVFSRNDKIWTEDGYSISPEIFWADRKGPQWEEGWEIYKPEGTGALAD